MCAKHMQQKAEAVQIPTQTFVDSLQHLLEGSGSGSGRGGDSGAQVLYGEATVTRVKTSLVCLSKYLRVMSGVLTTCYYYFVLATPGHTGCRRRWCVGHMRV